jgi:acyl phosphate:glycerol-3-phosphate acyltransferase
MDPVIASLAAVIGYLFGSLSFTRIIGKFIAPNEDLGKTEFTAPGINAKVVMTGVSATSLSMRKGPKAGCPTSILDMLKVTLPTLAFKIGYPDAPYFLITAAMGVVGHNWTLYHGFKGGRGLSAIIGGMLVIDWSGIIITNLLGMILGIALFRDVLIAYLGGAILLIPWLWYRTSEVWHIAYAVVVSTSLLIAMQPEIKQYIEFRRKGAMPDLKTVLSVTDMGKGMGKMFKRLGLSKDKSA